MPKISLKFVANMMEAHPACRDKAHTIDARIEFMKTDGLLKVSKPFEILLAISKSSKGYRKASTWVTSVISFTLLLCEG